jgi:hypothetical protein
MTLARKEMNFKHKDILNRLSDMQRLPYYAVACHDLVKAEMAIVQLETELAAAQAVLKQALEALEKLTQMRLTMTETKNVIAAIQEQIK